jgi:hypothetical protein
VKGGGGGEGGGRTGKMVCWRASHPHGAEEQLVGEERGGGFDLSILERRSVLRFFQGWAFLPGGGGGFRLLVIKKHREDR